MQRDDLRGQAHGRREAQLGGAHPGERRGAVEHDPRPDPVHVRRGKGQHRGGVGETALVERHVLKVDIAIQLLAGELVTLFVGTGQVADQVDFGHLRRGAQAFGPVTDLLGGEAQPVHAGIQLEPDVELAVAAQHQQALGLLSALHRHIQVERHGRAPVFLVEAAFQQQDARLGRIGAHHAGLLHTAHGEPVGLLGQRRRHHGRAVTVGIGLDHRQGAPPRRTALGLGVVVTDGGQIDRGDEGAHGKILCSGKRPGKAYSSQPGPQGESGAATPSPAGRWRVIRRRRTGSYPAPGSRSANSDRGRPGAPCRSARYAACR